MVNENPDQPYEGAFRNGEHRYAVRVHFEDTDAGGVVHHASYLRFMERARSDMLRLAGIDQRRALAEGRGVYAVVELAIRYRRPAHLDDALLVVSRVTEIRAASCCIHQRVMRGDVMIADAEVTPAFVGPEGRPKRQPREWVAIFEALRGEPSG
jgi:acyl-CoA thioester hydrolase